MPHIDGFVKSWATRDQRGRASISVFQIEDILSTSAGWRQGAYCCQRNEADIWLLNRILRERCAMYTDKRLGWKNCFASRSTG